MTELNAVLKSHSHRCSGDATTSTVVAASQCLGKEPEHEEMCKGEACVSWNLGQWGACSGQCGTGLRHRSVDCAEEMSGDVVPDGRCNKPKPSTSSACVEAACQVQICHIMILTFLILPTRMRVKLSYLVEVVTRTGAQAATSLKNLGNDFPLPGDTDFDCLALYL